MKTLTLRQIPKRVQEIIIDKKYHYEPATKTIFRLIEHIPELNETINKLRKSINDCKHHEE